MKTLVYCQVIKGHSKGIKFVGYQLEDRIHSFNYEGMSVKVTNCLISEDPSECALAVSLNNCHLQALNKSNH